jgi:hypothetical protein
MTLQDNRPGLTWIYDEVLDSALSEHAKILYVALCRHANKQGTSFPKYATLQKKTSTSEATVKRALKELKDHDVVSVINRPGTSNIFTINQLHEMNLPEHNDQAQTEPTESEPGQSDLGGSSDRAGGQVCETSKGLIPKDSSLSTYNDNSKELSDENDLKEDVEANASNSEELFLKDGMAMPFIEKIEKIDKSLKLNNNALLLLSQCEVLPILKEEQKKSLNQRLSEKVPPARLASYSIFRQIVLEDKKLWTGNTQKKSFQMILITLLNEYNTFFTEEEINEIAVFLKDKIYSPKNIYQGIKKSKNEGNTFVKLSDLEFYIQKMKDDDELNAKDAIAKRFQEKNQKQPKTYGKKQSHTAPDSIDEETRKLFGF